MNAQILQRGQRAIILPFVKYAPISTVPSFLEILHPHHLGLLPFCSGLIPQQQGNAYFLVQWGCNFYDRRRIFIGWKFKFRMEIVALSQLFSKVMRSLVIVLVVHRSNNRLRVWTRVEWMQASLSDGTTCNRPIFFVWATKKQRLWLFIALGKQGKIITVSVLTILPSSLGPWHCMNLLNGWGKGKDFCWGL